MRGQWHRVPTRRVTRVLSDIGVLALDVGGLLSSGRRDLLYGPEPPHETNEYFLPSLSVGERSHNTGDGRFRG